MGNAFLSILHILELIPESVHFTLIICKDLFPCFLFPLLKNLRIKKGKVIRDRQVYHLVFKLCLTLCDPMGYICRLLCLWGRRQWQPTPVLLPGKSHGHRSPVGCSCWGRCESDTTEWLRFHFQALEKEMATHSSVLACRIPGTREPGGLPSMGLHRVGHD